MPRITFDINTALRRRQPDDLAWIDVESIRACPVLPRQLLATTETQAWVNIGRQRTWEPAVCYYVDDAGRYDVMSGHDFSELLIYRLLGLGRSTPSGAGTFSNVITPRQGLRPGKGSMTTGRRV